MAGRLGTVIDNARPIPVGYTVGTVASIDMDTLSCTVDPEDGGEPIRNIPLRITRPSDTYGVTIIPKLGTEAIVVWLDRKGSELLRPKILEVQKWDKIIIHDDRGFGLTITAQGDVKIGSEADATHPLVYGDTLTEFLNALTAHLNANCRSGAPLIPACPAVPDFESGDALTS